MITSLARAALTLLAVGLLTSPVGAQVRRQPEKADGPDVTPLELLKAPETADELWDAVRFSVNVGRPDEALKYLDRLLASDPPIELLIKIRERDGATVLPKLSATAELMEKRVVLENLINKAVQSQARRPERIQQFIDYLTRSSAHRAYAIAQLRGAGADAVPGLLAALADPSLAEHRATIRMSMEQLDTAAVPPLVAALQTDDPALLADVVLILGVLGTRDTVPHLRYIAEAPGMPQALQSLARWAVERILDRRYADLPAAPTAMVDQATRYYEHKVDLWLSAAGNVRLWRWVPREGPRAEDVSLDYAEEYFGLLHCRQALALAPDHEPAQIMLLSLALEKASGRVGIDQPLPEGPGRASAEGLVAGPAVLNKVLARALDEGRPAVALAALRALGQTASGAQLAAQAGRPTAVVRSLSSPDRRIQFAAAEAILSLRPQQPVPGTSQIVPALTRALVTEGKSKALVIDYDTTRGTALASLLSEAGYHGEFAASVREGFTLAAESGDFELIFIEPNMPEPTLSPTLAMFRGDPRTAGVPIVVVGPLEMEKDLTKFERRYPLVKFFARPLTVDALKLQLDPLVAGLKSKPLTPAERAAHARAAVAWLARLARGEIRGIDPRPAEPALLSVLGDETLGPDAIAAVSLLPSARSQGALADLILNDSAPMPLRLEAARQARTSVKLFGVALARNQIAALVELLDRTDEPVFHQAVAGAIGAMKLRSAEIGDRLRRYSPPPFEGAAGGPAPEAPEAAKPPAASAKPAEPSEP